jgi:pyruvate dehydrogenase E2 component (dihydrolipoamide acetyltransferase)
MSTEVTMPQMGADMTEGTVVKWLKQVGDTIERGDIIAEIETDKATVELEAFESGQLLKLVAEEGDVIPVGDVIAILGEAGEEVADGAKPASSEKRGRTRVAKAPEKKAETPTEKEPEEDEGEDAEEREAEPARERIRVSPVARRIADEHGVDISKLKGSGPDGRILRRDVESAISEQEEAPAKPKEEETAAAEPARARREETRAFAGKTEELSRMRQTIARRMTQSKQQQPHYYLTVDVDMTDALAFRKTLNESASDRQRVSINDLIVKACTLALERHPKFTAQFTEEGLRYAAQLDINIGIALDEGLIAPAIMDCGRKTLGRIAEDSKDLVERAKEGKLRADEYSAGCFTITNLGNYGVESLIGIINAGQAAILGVGSVMPQPVVHDGDVVVHDIMKIALSADHRVSDGAEGAVFIKEIQGLLENPVSLAL